MSTAAVDSFLRHAARLLLGAAAIGPLLHPVRIRRTAPTLAHTLTLTTASLCRDLPMAMAVGPVLFTPVVRGLTLPRPIRFLGLARGGEGGGTRGTGGGPVRLRSAGTTGDG